MPYLQEHACRLASPGQFDTFRRETRTTDGKTYSIIFGRSGSGPMREQAYRYNRKSWTAAEAGAHCRAHKGQFEAAVSEAFASPEWANKVHQLIERGFPEVTAQTMASRMVYGRDK